MGETICHFRVPAIADSSSVRDRAKANGDVLHAVSRHSEHLLRVVAGFLRATLSLRMAFSPGESVSDPQSRLHLTYSIRTEDGMPSRPIEVLLEQGPIATLYPLEKVPEVDVNWDEFRSACHVYRRDRLVKPVTPACQNSMIPAAYYSWSEFEPNEENDFLDLDSVLDGITSPLLIDICVQPVDATEEIAALGRYNAFLEEIDHSWDRDEGSRCHRDLLGDRDQPYDVDPILPFRHSDSSAGTVLRSLAKSAEILHRPQVRFHIIILSGEAAVARLIGSVLAASGFENGSYQLFTHEDPAVVDKMLDQLRTTRVLDETIHPHLTRHSGNEYPQFARVPHMASVDELVGMLRPMVGSSLRPPRCIRTTTDPPKLDGPRVIVLGHDVGAGAGTTRKAKRGIELNALNKHLLITSIPGQGKTTCVANIASQLWENDIPFLVLETAKKEHRALKMNIRGKGPPFRELAKAMEVYSVDPRNINPYRFNPFAVPDGICLDQHIDSLWADLQGAIPQSGSLPGLLREGPERVYEEYPSPKYPPVFADLFSVTLTVLEEKEYSADTHSDFRGALELRIGNLTRGTIGRVFQCRCDVPDTARLIRTPTVIEMDCLSASYMKCVFSLMLLSRIQAVFRSQGYSDVLRYVVIIEEAHNILGIDSQGAASEDNPDPRAFVTELVCLMLAELRALGVGVIIIDQSPTKLPDDVLKQPASTLTFRLREKKDRDAIGAVMLFGSTEMEEVARLVPGEAFFITENYYGPRRINTINVHEEVDLTPPSDDELLRVISSEKWYREAARKRVEMELEQLRQAMDSYDEEWMPVAAEAAKLLSSYPECLAIRESAKRAERARALGRQARALQDRVKRCEKRFLRRSYARLLPPIQALPLRTPSLHQLREGLVNRFEEITAPAIQHCVELLDGLAKQCRSLEFEQE